MGNVAMRSVQVLDVQRLELLRGSAVGRIGIERTWVFNLGSAIGSYKIRLEGTTTTVLKTFSIPLRKDYVL